MSEQNHPAEEQRDAISEVLRAMARTLEDLPGILAVIAQSAARYIGAGECFVLLRDGDMLRSGAVGARGRPLGRTLVGVPLTRDSMSGRAVLEGKPIQFKDTRDVAEFPASRFGPDVPTALAVPLMAKEAAIGTLVFGRVGEVPRPFTSEEITLAQTFADEAVIALELARLFTELKESNVTLEARVQRQVTEIERAGRLRRFVSPQVAEALLASAESEQTLLQPHRREITVLFCDLRGSTAFFEAAEPEDGLAVLREYHQAMGELIQQHDGTLEHFAGDGLMVFFNDPIPIQDHQLRTVRLALDMRARVKELSAGWRRLGHELGFGVGIASGYATLGQIGFSYRMEYGAVGSVVNLAARLSDEAADGQILANQRVLAATEGRVQAEPAGDRNLKGFSRPVRAYQIVGLIDRPA